MDDGRLESIAVLPNGKVAVRGGILQSIEKRGSNTNAEYKSFVDVYDANGDFEHRFREN